MDLKNNDALMELLAAQYVLGTLRGGARRRFETLVRDDPVLQEKTRRWQAHFAPLLELVPAVTPPPRVWSGIISRLPAFAATSKARPRLLDSLAFWRGFAAFASVVAVIALGVAFGPFSPKGGQPAQGELLATFSAPNTKAPLAVLLMPAGSDRVMLQVVAPDLSIPKDKSLQLWLVSPGSDVMVSAGVVPELDAKGLAQLSVADANALRHAKTLGLSEEPLGGSSKPTHALGFASWTDARI